MAKKIIKFTATVTVQKPTIVKFHTKDGKTVTFEAIQTVKVKQPVKFHAKKK